MPALISNQDRFLLAFRRELMSAAARGGDHYARLYWDDRDAFLTAYHAAWAAGRPEPYASLARTLADAGDLSVKAAIRLAVRLNAAQRWREAEAALRDPRFRLLDGPAGQLELARANLGQGRLREASAALARARELQPSLAAETAALEATIGAVRAAESAARASGAWPETSVLMERWIDLGAPEAALRSLTAFLAGEGTVSREQAADFHFKLDAMLSLGPEGSLYGLFRALGRLFPSQKVQADLRLIADGLGGPAGDARPELPPAWRSHNSRLHASAALAWGMAGRLEAAVDTLGELTLRHPKTAELRPALARFVGRDVLQRHPLGFAPAGRRKVFDVFIFNNELRLLKLKLHAMADWVDHFVLVEARHTFTGAKKPLVFKRHREEFAAFADKIVHVIVDAFPEHVRHPWSREFHQRDMGVVGLNGRCGEDDLVIISDADEVISREAVLGFEGERARLGMERARYFLNYREALGPEALKDASSLWRARDLARIGLSYARNVLRFDKKSVRLANAGWHFTSIADARGIAAKLSVTAHQEHANVDVENVAAGLAALRAGRLEPGWERCELDERFPAWLRAHQGEFADVLL